MLTGEGGGAASFPNYKLNGKAALRFPGTSLLSTPILDFCAMIFLPALRTWLDFSSSGGAHYLAFWTLTSGFSILLICTQGGYSQPLNKNYLKLTCVAISDFIATSAGMLAESYLSIHNWAMPKSLTILELCLAPILLLGIRYLWSTKILKYRPLTPITGPVVICRGTCPADLNDFLAELAEFQAVSATLTLGTTGDDRNLNDEAMISTCQKFISKIIQHDVHDIIFMNQSSLDNFNESIPLAYRQRLLIRPIRLWLAVDTARQFYHVFVSESEKYRLIPLSPNGLVSSRTRSKRLFDIVMASILLIFAFPFLLTLAVLVRASGPGPVIFRQKRIGAQGRDFIVLKFRTMKDAPGSPFAQASLHDERVTKIGRFLRRSSLDELLQLVNVLRGEMSLVGPRPHAPETHVNGVFFDAALDTYPLRYRVKPGITGLAQIRGLRGATNNLETLRLRTESDLEYIRRWSLWLDIKILFASLSIFVRHDAY
jgi:exopolysaccharide biosynthesis polyprenyl glycosylphosphotransferase